MKSLTFLDTVDLILVLPGKLARKFRSKFAKILHHYYAGDMSLCPKIHADAQSTHPIPQFATDSIEMVHEGENSGIKFCSFVIYISKFDISFLFAAPDSFVKRGF